MWGSTDDVFKFISAVLPKAVETRQRDEVAYATCRQQ